MNLINISGNALLVYALKFGVDGVAIPTLLSRMYAAVAAFVLVHNKRYPVRCSYPVKLKPDFHMLKKILGIGIPNGLENSMFQLGKIMVLSMITQFGTASIAANAVSNTIAVFQTLPGMAIGNAVLTVSAQCAGAGDYEQVKYYAKKLHIIIYGLMIVCCLGVIAALPAVLPGAAIALVIAAAAKFLESLEESAGLHFIGASVIAMFIGMIVNAFYKPNSVTAPGIKFTSKKILKFAIILLGASLNIRTVLTVGRFSLTVMVFTLATCFGLGALIGKALGLNWKTSSLINAGTGICGGSAIAAIAPVIEATDMDIAYGLSATFLFDTVMIVVFPILGHWMGLSDAAFGLWAGTAVNDTSSVVATGYAFSEAAGDFATMVKLTRTLAIIPAVLAFAAINVHLKRKAQAAEGTAVKVSIKSIFPWFILGFSPCLH